MKIPKILILICICHAGSFAQTKRDSIRNNSYDRLILAIDATINSTYDSIQSSFERQNKNTNEMKSYNKAVCAELKQKLPVLENSIYSQFGANEDTKNQVQPYMTSLSKCIHALEQLTNIKEMISENDQNNYSNTYLFKELAKGNLFRYLNTAKITPTRFSTVLSFGVQSNSMNTTIQDAYLSTPWKGESGGLPDLKNNNVNKNLCASLQLNYRVSEKGIAGMEYKTLPSVQLSGQTDPSIFTRTLDSVGLPTDTLTHIVNGNFFSESLKGYALAINADYIIKNNKPSGFGIQLSAGASLQYNQYTLSREMNVSQLDSSLILMTIISTPNFTLDTASAVNYFTQTEEIHREYNLHSISIGIHASADYHLNKFASIKFSVSQSIDTGAKIDELSYYNASLPSYTIRFTSFSASVGLAFHF